MPPANSPSKAPKSSKPSHPVTLAGTVVIASDARARILADYEKAVTFMQQGNYSAAHPALEDLLKTAPPEFTDRIRMYLAACIAQSNKPAAQFSSPEEKYDYAIALLNDGQYEDARDHLNEILGDEPNADYAFYGLAVLASMTGDAQTCLDKLGEAIQRNPQHRIHARSDSDFQDMQDDPRFTELLYPEG
jgi:tetratricopeptide (TPR) repeat protein